MHLLDISAQDFKQHILKFAIQHLHSILIRLKLVVWFPSRSESLKGSENVNVLQTFYLKTSDSNILYIFLDAAAT